MIASSVKYLVRYDGGFISLLKGSERGRFAR